MGHKKSHRHHQQKYQHHHRVARALVSGKLGASEKIKNTETKSEKTIDHERSLPSEKERFGHFGSTYVHLETHCFEIGELVECESSELKHSAGDGASTVIFDIPAMSGDSI